MGYARGQSGWMSYSILFVTFPNRNSAEKISNELLNRKLVACVNSFTPIKNKYWWKGKIEMHSEILMILKIKSRSYKKIETLIKKLHPYEVPEILAINIDKGNKDYLSWISSVTK